jgi:hypothetical protein
MHKKFSFDSGVPHLLKEDDIGIMGCKKSNKLVNFSCGTTSVQAQKTKEVRRGLAQSWRRGFPEF